MTDFRQVIGDLAERTRQLRRASAEAWASLTALHRAGVVERALPARVEELIALAIAVVKHCNGCSAFHAKAADDGKRPGRRWPEALDVAWLMDGGTASVYGPRPSQAYPESATSPVPVGAGNRIDRR
jgi:AhpD family alkylhydroperoxidase